MHNILEDLTFTITALAFLAAAKAIILQKEAIEKQEVIGAWQLLTTKASGNSGKKEAIEFLASKGADLSGIDLSTETHGGFVYLRGLFKDYKGDRNKINLNNAKFNGADLKKADFTEAALFGADFRNSCLEFSTFKGCNLTNIKFNKAEIYDAKFIDLELSLADFSDCEYIELAEFKNVYCAKFTKTNFPKNLPQGYEFVIDERVDENGKSIYPKGDPLYRFIKLVKLEI